MPFYNDFFKNYILHDQKCMDCKSQNIAKTLSKLHTQIFCYNVFKFVKTKLQHYTLFFQLTKAQICCNGLGQLFKEKLCITFTTSHCLKIVYLQLMMQRETAAAVYTQPEQPNVNAKKYFFGCLERLM